MCLCLVWGPVLGAARPPSEASAPGGLAPALIADYSNSHPPPLPPLTPAAPRRPRLRPSDAPPLPCPASVCDPVPLSAKSGVNIYYLFPWFLLKAGSCGSGFGWADAPNPPAALISVPSEHGRFLPCVLVQKQTSTWDLRWAAARTEPLIYKEQGSCQDPHDPTRSGYLEKGITLRTHLMQNSHCLNFPDSVTQGVALGQGAGQGPQGRAHVGHPRRQPQSRALPPVSGFRPHVSGCSGFSSCPVGLPSVGSPSQGPR